MRKLGKWKTCLAAMAAGSILWNVFPPPAPWVELGYSRGLQPVLASVVIPVGDLFPFPLGALLCAAAAALMLGWIAVDGIRALRGGIPLRRRALRWGGVALQAVIIGYAWFLLVWGAGYRRERLEDRLGLGSARPEEGEIEAWIGSLTGMIRRDLPAPGERDEVRAVTSIRESLVELLREWEGRGRSIPHRLKRLPAGTLLASGTVGMLIPFFLEAHVDAGDLEVGRLQAAGHELAHAAGLCGEADADLAGAMAGLRARDPYARYAAALSVFRDFAQHLPRDAMGKAYAELPAEAVLDLEGIAKNRKSYRADTLARVGRRAYDSYLRSHGLEEGVKEYGRLVELLVRAVRKGIVSLP